MRFHDLTTLDDKFKPPILEFHPSYDDLSLSISEYSETTEKECIVFHCPEMIDKNNLLNLAALDNDVRQNSVQWFQNFLVYCKDTLTVVRSKNKPKIVVNVGGFSSHGWMTEKQIIASIDALGTSLEDLNFNDFDLLPQTMPPFPWHFGGQRYHNLFVKPKQIIDLASILKLKICFDTSHTILACNHYGMDFLEESKKILEFSSHIHLGDAVDESAEGLQLGDGILDLPSFFKSLKSSSWRGTIIPEIWQGHLNGGAGFEIALEKMEDSFEKY